MARFGQGLIQALTNPAYADKLNMAGMMAGSMPGRLRAEEEERNKKMRDAQIASLEASATGITEEAARKRAMAQQAMLGQVASAQDPGVAAAAQAGAMRAGVKPTDVKAAAGMATQGNQLAAWNNYLTKEGRTDLIGVNPKEAAAILKADKEAIGKGTLEGKDRYLSVGGSVLDMTNNTWASPPTSSEVSSITPAQIAALYEKNTPESVQSFLIDPMKNILVPLESSGGPERGEVPASVEKQFAAINEESGAASVSLNQNRNLQQTLLSDPSKATGIVSDLRTFALDIAGLRDAEEETKTTFLRNRNTQIINSLPPGVATDRDVTIFSQGFPASNASSEEILRYLQVEEKMLSYSADMGLLADRHLQQQINPSNGQPGQKASMVGFIDKRTSYANVMRKAERLIGEARANNDVATEQQLISQLSAVLGFTPKLYE